MMLAGISRKYCRISCCNLTKLEYAVMEITREASTLSICRFHIASGAAATVATMAVAVGQAGPLVVWGTTNPAMLNVPSGNYLTADPAGNFIVGVREDQTLVAWGDVESAHTAAALALVDRVLAMHYRLPPL